MVDDPLNPYAPPPPAPTEVTDDSLPETMVSAETELARSVPWTIAAASLAGLVALLLAFVLISNVLAEERRLAVLGFLGIATATLGGSALTLIRLFGELRRFLQSRSFPVLAAITHRVADAFCLAAIFTAAGIGYLIYATIVLAIEGRR